MRKLKSIGLISIFKDVKGSYNVGLTIDAYKYFVKKNLIEDVKEVLKRKQTQTQQN